MDEDGFALLRRVIPLPLIVDAQEALLRTAKRLGAEANTLDDVWCEFKRSDRALGGLLYNSAKLLPQIVQLAVAPELRSALKFAGLAEPVLVDVNFRIDSHGEEKFLFDWHQDYWFSICSPQAVVCWIPLMPVTDETGGVELISNRDTGGRIFRARPGQQYRSYADAAVLDEPVDNAHPHRFEMDVGDVLLFRFNVLHRSLPVKSPRKSRWTLQTRFADLADPAFRAHDFKPAQVTPGSIPYLEGA